MVFCDVLRFFLGQGATATFAAPGPEDRLRGPLSWRGLGCTDQGQRQKRRRQSRTDPFLCLPLCLPLSPTASLSNSLTVTLSLSLPAHKRPSILSNCLPDKNQHQHHRPSAAQVLQPFSFVISFVQQSNFEHLFI